MEAIMLIAIESLVQLFEGLMYPKPCRIDDE
jgi:hypothetical protein